MKSNFNKPLFLKAGDSLHARGPLEWQPGDPPAVRVKIEFTQGGQKVSGDCGNASFACPGNPPCTSEWSFDLDTHGKLQPGDAEAWGEISPAAGGSKIYKWPDKVPLQAEP